MATGSFESLCSAIDPPAGRPPAETGDALRTTVATLRGLLGLAWLAVALQAHASIEAKRLLGACAVLAWVWVAPRAVVAIGSGLGAWIAVRDFGVGASLALIVLGALTLRLLAGGAGRWLRDVQRLERRRAVALAATGLALAVHRSRGEATALTRAGDLYERAGRARSALEAIGAHPSAAIEWIRGGAEHAGRLLAPRPGLLDRALKLASRRSE